MLTRARTNQHRELAHEVATYYDIPLTTYHTAETEHQAITIIGGTIYIGPGLTHER